ncbi:hypothetical protein BD410DRAFT_875796 [Rickenella mellea]|uniref:Arrestin-like N-terminal domain-containing protein n=1 Tax=Rickenella mellea TaxID=50990 RepID=A0A4Y7QJM5_9AGAM|nr:hypothetical protein BD410DRAFT_875796 [Rickenella mellea]
MVKLTLHSHRGNSNSRFFPHTGYLALTPVKVEGVVRTKLDDDAKPLQASSLSVSVRCIESRLGRLGVTNSNVLVEYTQKLWSKPPNVDFAPLGDSEHTFKIIIPAHTPGYSCATFKDYRVYWRVEAFIDHSPAFGIGSRQTKGYEISLIRHDTTVPRRSVPVFPGFIKSSKPRAPVIRYHYATPSTAVGPLDIVSIPVTVQPVDPSVSIRGASVIIERRIDLHETSDYTYPSPIHSSPTSPLSSRDVNDSTLTLQSTQSSCAPGPSAYRSCATPHIDSSVLTLSSTASNSTFTISSASENRPLLPPTVLTVPAKTVSLNVAGAESSGPFDRNSQGVYSKTLTFQWPAPKSHSHWAMGQTMETDLITVRFFAHIKVCDDRAKHVYAADLFQ